MRYFVLFIFIVTGLFANNCSDMYYQGYKPMFNGNVKDICYSEYNTLYNVEKGFNHPILSAEKLTPNRLKKANALKRVDSFHNEPSLSINEQATVDEYKSISKHYDKGHLAPNKDFSNKVAQEECFSMVNMIPQTSENNRGVWSKLEAFVRHLGFKNKEMYVYTGPLYDNTSKAFTQKTKIPTYIWKVVYIPSTNSGIAFISTNDTSPEIFTKSIVEFEKILGYKLFKDSSTFLELDTSEFRFDKTIQHSNGQNFTSKISSLIKFFK